MVILLHMFNLTYNLTFFIELYLFKKKNIYI